MSNSLLGVFVFCLMELLQNHCPAVELDRSCSQQPYPDAKIIQFTVIEDLEHARQAYQSGSVSCGFGPDQMSEMTFTEDGTSALFHELKSGIPFSCMTWHKVGPYINYDVVPITPHLLASIIDAPFLKFRNCIYAKPNVLSQDQDTLQRAAILESRTQNSTGAALNLADNEKRLIIQALRESDNDIAAASKKLGITEKALLRKMKGCNMGESRQ